MYLAHDVANWTLYQADNLRKLTKLKGKYPEKVEKWKKEFIEGAEKNGVGSEAGKEIWEKVVDSFNGYGFNKCLHFNTCITVYDNVGNNAMIKPIEDIKPGDYVKSRDEKTKEDIFIEVVELHDHGELELVEVELDTGETVKCTTDHKFRVKETNEMLPLWEIIEKDYSIIFNKDHNENKQ
jgi:hypothetical protein